MKFIIKYIMKTLGELRVGDEFWLVHYDGGYITDIHRHDSATASRICVKKNVQRRPTHPRRSKRWSNADGNARFTHGYTRVR